ncbi:hypothetical protein BC827DRAFT_1378613 [Russula dissimulans]|nr:hypothetical protein BC827DRAFT_1378613 [Russula dissimulans]
MSFRISKVLIMGVGAIAGAFLAPAGLSAVGFSSTRPVAGSMAARWQAGIGNVASGSLFSVAQSAAMGGGMSSAVSAAGAMAGAATAAAAAFWSSIRRRR